MYTQAVGRKLKPVAGGTEYAALFRKGLRLANDDVRILVYGAGLAPGNQLAFVIVGAVCKGFQQQGQANVGRRRTGLRRTCFRRT